MSHIEGLFMVLSTDVNSSKLVEHKIDERMTVKEIDEKMNSTRLYCQFNGI
jgi:hypothetical protein